MILEEETFEKFGYYPCTLRPRSGRKLFAACDKCGKIRITTKHEYRDFCHSCAISGERNPNYKPKIKIVCKECGNKSDVVPSRKDSAGFCSLTCLGKWRSKNLCGEKSACYGKKHNEETKQKIRNARMHRSFPKYHTKPELIFEAICKKYNLPFHFVGDGSLWIGKKKPLNPDFCELNGKKIVIEIFGDYWHSPLLNHKLKKERTLNYRKQYYKRYGWTSVFFWETDLLRNDAEQFILNSLQKGGLI